MIPSTLHPTDVQTSGGRELLLKIPKTSCCIKWRCPLVKERRAPEGKESKQGAQYNSIDITVDSFSCYQRLCPGPQGSLCLAKQELNSQARTQGASGGEGRAMALPEKPLETHSCSFTHSARQLSQPQMGGLRPCSGSAMPWKNSVECTWHFSSLFQFTQVQVTPCPLQHSPTRSGEGVDARLRRSPCLAFPGELHGDGFVALTCWTLSGQVSVLQTPPHHYSPGR